MSAPTPAPAPVLKPKLRGVLHQWAALAALAAGIVLVAMAPGARAAWAGGVFAVSLVALFTVSASYHRPNWGPVARAWMRRLDHASIFLLIAGTYTPVALLAVDPELGRRLLWIAWGGALLGVVQSLAWIHAPKPVHAAVYLALGWAVVPYLSELRRALSGPELALIGLGGLAYTLGALAYATKRPNPRPATFGYHEVFHACTLVAAALHFAAVLLLVKRG